MLFNLDNKFAEIIAKYENTIPYEEFIETLDKCKELCNTKNNDNKLIKKCIDHLSFYLCKSKKRLGYLFTFETEASALTSFDVDTVEGADRQRLYSTSNSCINLFQFA